MTTTNAHNIAAQPAPLIIESDGSFEATSAEVASIFHTASRIQEIRPFLTDEEAFESARESLIHLLETGELERYDDGENIYYLHVPSQILTNMTVKFADTAAYVESRLEEQGIAAQILAAEQHIEQALRNAQEAVSTAFSAINGLIPGSEQ